MKPKKRWNEARCEIGNGREPGYICTLPIHHEGDHKAYSDTGKVVTDGHMFGQWQNHDYARIREDREVEQWLEENCR